MYTLLMFRKFLRMIKIDWNLWELWQFVCKKH